MNDTLIVEMWDLIKEYVDKKHLSVIAERYVDLLGDHGTSEENFESALDHDDALDEAIKNLLDIEDDPAIEDEEYE